jgi:N-acyl homoserine lactone hydrolase
VVDPAHCDRRRVPDRSARRLSVLCCGGERTRRALLDPWDACVGDLIEIPYYCYLVEHPGGLVLVDCGINPHLVADPVGALGEQAAMSELLVAPGDDVATKLSLIGFEPADVAHVLLTHLHYDHCGGLCLLPGATVHVQAAERAFASSPPPYQAPAYLANDWAGVEAWRWREATGEVDLFGDRSIVAFPTPGHTPGHQSVQVRLPEGEVILVGDAAYHPAKMAERRLPGYLWNPDALLASWEEIERRRDRSGAHLLFSHHPDPDLIPTSPEPWHP